MEILVQNSNADIKCVREVSQTDGRGNTTRTVYDSLGRVASTVDALGYATTYGYDALGRQTSVTGPLTKTWGQTLRVRRQFT